jgi:hypothetical protein
MHTILRTKPKLAALILLVMALLASGLYQGQAYAATLPATTCSLSGSTRTCDLWAKTGTTTLPGGATVNVWGYTDSANGTVTSPGGPMLIVNQGETVTVNLNNTLAEASALLFQGQAMIPDTTGAASGGTKSYTFTATKPGTYVYEAGLLPNSEHQVAMGLYGALVVRPATVGQAYDDPATAFNDEAVLVLSELDPALNNSATPATFDMRDYAPKYFLINGKTYPNTDPIPTVAGNKVLLRYVNAGLQAYSMTVLGLRQNAIAMDGRPFQFGRTVVAETIAPGQTADMIATIPAAATTSTKFALYDGNLMLHNNTAGGPGGMLTFLTAGTGSVATGPATSGVALTPNPTNGSVDVSVSASLASASSTVSAAEYYIDSTVSTPTVMSGSFGSPTVAVNATLSTGQLLALASGNHTIFVRGQDATGTWGAFSSAVLNLDKAGPITSPPTLTPNPSNGSVPVALHATGNDTPSGGSNVVAAEYFIGAVGANGAGTPMAVNVAAPVVSLDATIAPPAVGGLVSVHSQDAWGNWGPFATITLNVVANGPVTSNVSAAKNPNNGALPLNSSNPVVRVTATMVSTGSTVSAAEGFLDTNPATTVRGFPFVPSDGAWNSATETGYSDIPLSTINALSAGNHTIYVRGKDAAGNWGTTAASVVQLLIDKTAPTFTSVTLSPTTAIVGETVTLTANGAADPLVVGLASGVSGGQYWIDGTATPPANATAFNGTSTTLAVLTGGVHTIYVRIRDAAGNWSTVRNTTLTVPSAVNDTLNLTANTNATQTSNQGAPGVLANDLPVGLAGRTATLVSGPVRTSGSGAGTIRVTCGGAAATGVCTNGSYRVTLTGVGGNGPARAASKRGTYQFTYTETLNGKTTPPATVTITVN